MNHTTLLGGLIMQPMMTTILSMMLLLSGGAALIIMMAKFGGRHITNPKFAILVHRILGWIFVALYLTLAVIMVRRLDDYWEVAPARVAIHVSLSVALFLLLTIKLMIPRFFPGLLRYLFPLGLTTYLTAFVLVGITGGYFLFRLYQGIPYVSHSAASSSVMDNDLGRELFIQKCGTCHLLRDIATPRNAKDWEEIVNRMVHLAYPRISPASAAQILHYLQVSLTPTRPEEHDRISGSTKHCMACHNIRNQRASVGQKIVETGLEFTS